MIGKDSTRATLCRYNKVGWPDMFGERLDEGRSIAALVDRRKKRKYERHRSVGESIVSRVSSFDLTSTNRVEGERVALLVTPMLVWSPV